MTQIEAGKIVFTKSSNRYAGVCADTGERVGREKGKLAARILSGKAFSWCVLSTGAVATRVAAGEEPVTAEQLKELTALRDGEKPPVPDPAVRRGRRGASMGLTLVETWRWMFQRNAELAGSGRKPLTDAEISSFMRGEFKELSAKATSENKVATARTRHNAGTKAFARWGAAQVPSVPYGDDGSPLPENQRRARRSSSGLDETAVANMIRREVARLAEVDRPILNVQFDKREVKIDTKGKHAAFADVMVAVSAGLNVLLVGPTGCGKSHLAGQVAQAMKLKFTFNSMSEGVSEAALLGRMMPDAKGAWRYHPSPFVKSFKDGGVHLLDEIDAADPNLLVQVNSALTNGMLSVPQSQAEPFQRHKDFVLIAAANTWGHGADRQYVGRNQLDESTLNRFKMGTVEVDYDKKLEEDLARAILKKDSAMVDVLLSWAWHVRSRIASCRLRHVMSTRDVQDAAKLIKADGTSGAMDRVKRAYFGGWSVDERAKVEV